MNNLYLLSALTLMSGCATYTPPGYYTYDNGYRYRNHHNYNYVMPPTYSPIIIHPEPPVIIPRHHEYHNHGYEHRHHRHHERD